MALTSYQKRVNQMFGFNVDANMENQPEMKSLLHGLWAINGGKRRGSPEELAQVVNKVYALEARLSGTQAKHTDSNGIVQMVNSAAGREVYPQIAPTPQPVNQGPLHMESVAPTPQPVNQGPLHMESVAPTPQPVNQDPIHASMVSATPLGTISNDNSGTSDKEVKKSFSEKIKAMWTEHKIVVIIALVVLIGGGFYLYKEKHP